MKKTTYQIMKSAVTKEFEPSIKEINSMNSFLLTRYISNDPNSIYVANAINCSPNVPLEAQYKFIRNSSLNSISYINYPKDVSLPIKDVNTLLKHFNIKKEVLKDYLSILGEDKVKEILKLYK